MYRFGFFACGTQRYQPLLCECWQGAADIVTKRTYSKVISIKCCSFNSIFLSFWQKCLLLICKLCINLSSTTSTKHSQFCFPSDLCKKPFSVLCCPLYINICLSASWFQAQWVTLFNSGLLKMHLDGNQGTTFYSINKHLNRYNILKWIMSGILQSEMFSPNQNLFICFWQLAILVTTVLFSVSHLIFERSVVRVQTAS